MMWIEQGGKWYYRTRNISQGQLAELAAKLALVGGPNDPEAQRTYNAVVPLCMALRRVKYIGKDGKTKYRPVKWNLDLLPADRTKLLRITYLTEQVVETFGPTKRLNFSLRRLIEAALICPNPHAAKVHIDRCMSGPDKIENPAPHTILTPGAMDWSKNRFRGPFCEYKTPEEYDSYMAQVKAKLRTVSG